MKRNKTAKPDDIIIEMLSTIDGFRINKFIEMINEKFDNKLLEELSKDIFITMPKKSGAKEYEFLG